MLFCVNKRLNKSRLGGHLAVKHQTNSVPSSGRLNITIVYLITFKYFH